MGLIGEHSAGLVLFSQALMASKLIDLGLGAGRFLYDGHRIQAAQNWTYPDARGSRLIIPAGTVKVDRFDLACLGL